MKAVYFTEHGGPEVLTYGDIREPKVGSSDIKIRVRACALNRLDLFTRAGLRGTRLELASPHILGGDIAGDIVKLDLRFLRLKRGTEWWSIPDWSVVFVIHVFAGKQNCAIDPG